MSSRTSSGRGGHRVSWSGSRRGRQCELKTPASRSRWLSLLYSKRWVLYAKRPFGGPQQVLRYLANYTHRVALSNRRIVAVDAQHQTVTFTYRDYRHGLHRQLPGLHFTGLPDGAQFIAVASVPEPDPSSMIGVGGVALLGIMLRKRRRTA
jgi:hypothetical protein